jgi:hypothetical protein
MHNINSSCLKMTCGIGPLQVRANGIVFGSRLPGRPDWANFRLLGDFLLWAVFFKLQKWHKFLGFFFHGESNVLFFTKNGLGYILGDFPTNSSGHRAPNSLISFTKHSLF